MVISQWVFKATQNAAVEGPHTTNEMLTAYFLIRISYAYFLKTHLAIFGKVDD